MIRIYSIILSVATLIISADQWSKAIALKHLAQQGDSIPFMSWWNWTLVYNYGAAFGMLRNLPESIRTGFFIFLPLAVLVILWFAYVRHFKSGETFAPITMGLVLGGALGNLIDRIRFGYVVDFIDWFYPSKSDCIPLFSHFTPGTCHWPVFNFADSAICAAMILLAYHSLRYPTKD